MLNIGVFHEKRQRFNQQYSSLFASASSREIEQTVVHGREHRTVNIQSLCIIELSAIFKSKGNRSLLDDKALTMNEADKDMC